MASDQGIIAVNKDSDIYALENLQKVDMAFPLPASFAAQLFLSRTTAKINLSTTASCV